MFVTPEVTIKLGYDPIGSCGRKDMQKGRDMNVWRYATAAGGLIGKGHLRVLQLFEARQQLFSRCGSKFGKLDKSQPLPPPPSPPAAAPAANPVTCV